MAGRRAIHDFGGSRGRSNLAESWNRGRGENANADCGCYGSALCALNNAVLAGVAFWHLARRKAKIWTLFSANPYHFYQFLFFPKGLLLFFLALIPYFWRRPNQATNGVNGRRATALLVRM